MFQGKLKEKDINLLEVYGQKTEPSKYEELVKYAIPPVVIILLFGSLFGYFKFQELSINKKISDTNDKIDRIVAEQDVDGKQEKYQLLQTLNQQLSSLNVLYNNMNSYPEISKQVINGIFSSASVTVEVRTLSFSQDSAVVLLNVRTPYLSETDQIIRRLKKTGFFEDVQYSGYTSGDMFAENTTTETTTQQKDISSMTDEELRVYLSNLQNGNTPTTQETEKPIGKYYDISITCILKKVVAEE